MRRIYYHAEPVYNIILYNIIDNHIMGGLRTLVYALCHIFTYFNTLRVISNCCYVRSHADHIFNVVLVNILTHLN